MLSKEEYLNQLKDSTNENDLIKYFDAADSRGKG